MGEGRSDARRVRAHDGRGAPRSLGRSLFPTHLLNPRGRRSTQHGKIHPSLNDPTVYSHDTIIRDVSKRLFELYEAGEIGAAPSPSAISKAMMRRGSEVRKSVNVSVKAIKKVRAPSASIPTPTAAVS
jgi:hypothetical protein